VRPGLVRKARPHRPAFAGEEVTRVFETRRIRHVRDYGGSLLLPAPCNVPVSNERGADTVA
jgi:hypothetical protein